MARMSRLVACSFVLGLAALGCNVYVGGEGGAGGAGGVGGVGVETVQPEAVPPFSTKAIFLSVGEPSPIECPPSTELQHELAGLVYVLSESDQGFELVGQHLPAEIEGAMAELRIPYEDLPCVMAGDGGGGGSSSASGSLSTGAGGWDEGTGGGYTGLAGTNPLPAGQSEWYGADAGGCGVWAVAMCNRILGIRASSAHVTEEEWNDIGDEIGLEAGGESKPSLIQGYYAKRGYVASIERFDGTAADYEELTEKVNAGCDVKLEYARRTPEGKYESAHIETVVSASEAGAVTNSWGHLAQVKGGALGGFEHSRDASFRPAGAPSTPVWPADSTEVWVFYVCEASEFEQVMNAIF